jgi:putative membrane protein
MYWYQDHMSGWGYGLMAFSSLLFWALVVTGIVLLVRYLSRTSGRSPGGDRRSAERILAERFARGEIDEEEYRRRLETLRATTDPAGRP